MDRRIIIVEDEILVGMMLKKKIEDQGFGKAEIVTSGQDAVALVTSGKADLVVMDISLSGSMDGISAALEIREHSAIPIIFFTGNFWNEEIIQRCEAVNPVDIIDKMDDLSAVYGAIIRALKVSEVPPDG
jgi:CheY-like chemotaxis protein